jgi:cytochrome c peroxidase
MSACKASVTGSLAIALLAGLLGFWAGNALDRSAAQQNQPDKVPIAKSKPEAVPPAGDQYLRQSPAARATDRPPTDYGLGPNHVSKLKPYPPGKPGDRTPLDLYRYAGRGDCSWGSPNLPMSWDEWVKMCHTQKPKLMAEVHAYMESRYQFSGSPLPGARMSGGKPIMMGPVARLPKGIATFEQLSQMTPDEIRDRDLFPYKPLAHPLQTTAHMVFPASWTKFHPEHERMDVDLDIPDAYLPEFPPPMFLTTHKELGDVTGGREVTFANYFEIFNGLLTAEQMEGLKESLRPSADR